MQHACISYEGMNSVKCKAYNIIYNNNNNTCIHCTIMYFYVVKIQVMSAFNCLSLTNKMSQIHQQLVEQNLWGNRLKAFSWRIDVKTKARHIEQLNQPAAIMELQLSASNKDTSEVIMEMNEIYIATLYRYCLQARYHKPGEKCMHFSYPDISLNIRYGRDQPVDKGVRIIAVA